MLAAATQATIDEVIEQHAIDPSKLIIARGEEVKELIDPSEFDNVDDRLHASYGDKKAAFIWEVDVCLDEAKRRGDYSILFDGFTEFDKEVGCPVHYRGLNVEIERKAKFYSFQYKGFAITKEEFEHEFRIMVWELALKPQTEGKEMFTFYERVRQAFATRAIDYVRELTGGDPENPRNKQVRREFDAMPLHFVSESDIQEGTQLTPIRSSEADRVEANILVDGILASMESMTQDERNLLIALQDDPEATDNKLAKRLGVSNHKVKRLRAKLAATLQEFNPNI